jgi:hypothetical protein
MAVVTGRTVDPPEVRAMGRYQSIVIGNQLVVRMTVNTGRILDQFAISWFRSKTMKFTVTVLADDLLIVMHVRKVLRGVFRGSLHAALRLDGLLLACASN